MEDGQKQFSSFEIIDAFGLKRERFKDWLERDYIYPSIKKASGQGTKNIFSVDDLYRLIIFMHLLKRGYPRKTAGFMVKEITEKVKESKSDFRDIQWIIAGYESDRGFFNGDDSSPDSEMAILSITLIKKGQVFNFQPKEYIMDYLIINMPKIIYFYYDLKGGEFIARSDAPKVF